MLERLKKKLSKKEKIIEEIFGRLFFWIVVIKNGTDTKQGTVKRMGGLPGEHDDTKTDVMRPNKGCFLNSALYKHSSLFLF